MRLGAAIAYYGLVAMVPTLTVVAAVLTVFIDGARLHALLVEVLTPAFGAASDQVATLVVDTLAQTSSSLGLVGAGTVAFGATIFVAALMDVADEIWELPPGSGIVSTIRRRFMAFVSVVAVSVGLLAVLALRAITGAVAGIVPILAATETWWANAVTLAAIVAALVALYWLVPSTTVPLRAASVAGVVMAPLVAVGTVAIGAYLERVAARSTLAAAGGVFLVLVWLYYEAQIVLVGVVLSRVLAQRQEVAGSAAVDDHGPTKPNP